MFKRLESVIHFVPDMDAAVRVAMLIDPFGCTLGLNQPAKA